MQKQWDKSQIRNLILPAYVQLLIGLQNASRRRDDAHNTCTCGHCTPVT
jgi:hypothetical protein